MPAPTPRQVAYVVRRATLLRESETRYAYLFDAAGDVVLVYEIDGDSEIVEANRASQLAFGLDEEGRKGSKSVGATDDGLGCR